MSDSVFKLRILNRESLALFGFGRSGCHRQLIQNVQIVELGFVSSILICIISDTDAILLAFSSFSSHLHKVILDIPDQFSTCLAENHALLHVQRV